MSFVFLCMQVSSKDLFCDKAKLIRYDSIQLCKDLEYMWA